MISTLVMMITNFHKGALRSSCTAGTFLDHSLLALVKSVWEHPS